jgi:soluble lytic murein transglycosylase-like protein
VPSQTATSQTAPPQTAQSQTTQGLPTPKQAAPPQTAQSQTTQGLPTPKQAAPPTAQTQTALAPVPTPPADKTPEKVTKTLSTAELMRASIEKQRAAVRRQAQAAGATLIPWSPSPALPTDAPPAECDPIAADVVTPLIESAAKANDLQVPIVRAVIEQESAYKPCAVSRKGAQGLMQIMPDTAGDLNVKDVFDPKENIAAGAKYLKQLLDKYKGDNKLALAAYNAGPAAVDAANGVPDIQETRDYVDAILKKLK